jgi:hypothetical protein
MDVHPPMKVLNGDVIGAVRMVPGADHGAEHGGLQPLSTGAEQSFRSSI